jgi:hypothetical protein
MPRLVGLSVFQSVFKTSFAMKLPSKQGLLSMRGISARNTDKQANKQTKTTTVSVYLQLPPVESGCHGQGQQC